MQHASQHELHLGKWMGGAALGALAMYLLDPEHGATRRAASGDTLRDLGRQGGDVLEKIVRDLGDDAGGPEPHRQSEALRNESRDSEDKQDSQGKQASRDGQQSQPGGHTPDQQDAQSLVGALLHAGQPWKPGVRGAALVGGGTLGLASMLTRRVPLAFMLGLAAAALLTRGASNRSLRGMLGMPAGADDAHMVDIEKTIHIDAAPEQVFALWTNYDNFPRFMSNVLAVHDLGQGRSHWVVRGPAGTEYGFDAVLTEQTSPRRLAWQSLPGSEVQQSGSVELTEAGDGTRATVHLAYRPPAGQAGQALASLLGADPGQELDDDLHRMKDLLEGRPPVHASQGTDETGKFLH